jgi:hypothetical protein
MSRSQSKPHAEHLHEPKSNQQPVSREQYVRETQAACKDGRCCQDQAALDAAYEQYVNDPRAPWNKTRRR